MQLLLKRFAILIILLICIRLVYGIATIRWLVGNVTWAVMWPRSVMWPCSTCLNCKVSYIAHYQCLWVFYKVSDAALCWNAPSFKSFKKNTYHIRMFPNFVSLKLMVSHFHQISPLLRILLDLELWVFMADISKRMMPALPLKQMQQQGNWPQRDIYVAYISCLQWW